MTEKRKIWETRERKTLAQQEAARNEAFEIELLEKGDEFLAAGDEGRSKVHRKPQPRVKVEISLNSGRPLSKILSKVIHPDFGASDYFRHRWLEGFRSTSKVTKTTIPPRYEHTDPY